MNEKKLRELVKTLPTIHKNYESNWEQGYHDACVSCAKKIEAALAEEPAKEQLAQWMIGSGEGAAMNEKKLRELPKVWRESTVGIGNYGTMRPLTEIEKQVARACADELEAALAEEPASVPSITVSQGESAVCLSPTDTQKTSRQRKRFMMPEQREDILTALRHGQVNKDPEIAAEFEEIARYDLEALEPLIDQWIFEARDWYFRWTLHKDDCPGNVTTLDCTCGLTQAIADRRKV